MSDVRGDPILTKLTAARARLILDKPFLGALVLRLPLRAARPDWCPTTATDARAVYYNPDFIQPLSLAQTQFMLAHEALHCALSHFARRGHRARRRWDLACDLAVNPLLVNEGLTPPPQARVIPEYLGMTAEEIYPLIQEQDPGETLDTHAYDQDTPSRGGDNGDPRRERPQPPPPSHGDAPPSPPSGASAAQADPDQKKPQGATAEPAEADVPPPLTLEERERLAIQWQQRLAGAAQQALRAGKLSGTLARLLDHLLQPQLPWRMLLAHYLTALSREDYSYQRPSRREGEHILPSLRGHRIDLVVGLDTSGSIRQEELDAFLAEIQALKGQIRARVTLLPCDAALAPGAPWIYEPWEDFDCPARLSGGGGTHFRPVFDWVENQGLRPDLLVYFTDAEGEFPPQAPPFPVLWLVKGRNRVPWGQRVQLN